MSPIIIRLLSFYLCVVLPNVVPFVTSFSASTQLLLQNRAVGTGIYGSATVEAPTRPDTDTDRRTNRRESEERRSGNQRDANDDSTSTTKKDDLEYYIDPSASREMNEPFHILLMGSATYIQPKVTVSYVSATLEYVLGMPHTDAYELSLFAKDHDMSCLGTWTREQCLAYGKQLQSRDVVCRVVPYCLGGQRGWQAKDASSSESSFSNAEQS